MRGYAGQLLNEEISNVFSPKNLGRLSNSSDDDYKYFILVIWRRIQLPADVSKLLNSLVCLSHV